LVGKRHRTMRHVPSFNSRQTPYGTCADGRCSRVQRRREGPTVVPTPAFRDFQSLCSRAGLPRGANAPRSCVAVRTFAGEKRFLRWANAHSQERRASARRGYRYRTCSGASTKLLQTPDGACADRRCIRVQAYHGGLTPPAPGERTHIVGDARLRFATAFCFTRGADAPRSWLYMRLCIGKVAILSAQDGSVLSDLRSVFSEQGSFLVHSVSCACPGSSKVCVHPGFRTISAIRPVTAHGGRAFEQVTLPDLSDASMPPNPRCRVQGRG
jgi:hypothetical protein